MRAIGRGRGGGGRGQINRKNTKPSYTQNDQQEKKQKITNTYSNDSNWDEMSEVQQNEQFETHYGAMKESIETMMEENNNGKENENENKSIAPSIGTIGDRSLNSFEDHVCEKGGVSLTIQVSTKLSVEMAKMNEDEVFEEIVGASTKFIIAWLNKKMITGVIHNEYNIIMDDICGFRSWVEDFRIVGKSRRYAQIIFQVHSQVPWKMLIENGKEIFQEHNLSILLKRTKAKGWNRKIGILVGPRTEVAYLKEYEKELSEYSKIDIDYFELKKKMEKEGDVEAKCIVVYAVDDVAEQFDLALRNMVSERMDNLAYYSFINGSPDQRKQALTFNRLQNVKMKYEIIKNARVREKVKCCGVDMTMRKALSEVKVNDEVIFQAIEQGYGDMNDHMFLYYHPEYRRLVMQWFQDEFMKGIELYQRRELQTSITKYTKEQKQYTEKVDHHLNRAIAVKRSTLESLPLYHSTVSYASVVRGHKPTKQMNENDNVSTMTEGSNEKEKRGKMEKETNNKKKERARDENSTNEQGSVWSKESVLHQIKTLTDELENEKKEREKERQERLKEKEENRVVIENMMYIQQLFLNINEEDTDEEVGSQVKRLVRKMKKSEAKQKEKEKQQKDHENNNQNTSCKQEIDNEINKINASGLQSPPTNEKSDSSKFTSHSNKTERR